MEKKVDIQPKNIYKLLGSCRPLNLDNSAARLALSGVLGRRYERGVFVSDDVAIGPGLLALLVLETLPFL